MKREELDELMLMYASGVSEESETAEAEARLASGEPAAQASYAEALAVVNSLPLSLPLQTPRKVVRDKLLLRVGASLQEAAGEARPRNMPQSRSWRIWPAWVATGVAAALAIGLTLTLAENRRIQGELAVELSDQTPSVLSSPYVHLAKLGTDGKPNQAGKPCGRLVYCPVSQQYQLRVYRLAPPPNGRVYEMWLMTPDKSKVIPAGTFMVDETGAGTHYIKLPRGGEYAFAAISDEPVGGSEKPTGVIHLLGELDERPPLDERHQ